VTSDDKFVFRPLLLPSQLISEQSVYVTPISRVVMLRVLLQKFAGLPTCA